ncbi:MAG: hypothetical protein KZQ94_10445 [Candidatus Thiodiazotropha sp. (ex Troendleina suluensis)]|nr:hypothetical protein [Candidatus Thiodiazotropha sp. (ex Troendleina suluensis)]
MTELNETAIPAPKLVKVVVSDENGHTYQGVDYKKGATMEVTQKQKEKMKKRGVIE